MNKKTQKTHVSEVLEDFFKNQSMVFLTEAAAPTYFVGTKYAEFRVITNLFNLYDGDVRVVAHEIGHFLNADINKIHLEDYGIKNQIENWSSKMWDNEITVLAYQICILKKIRYNDQISILLSDLSRNFLKSSKKYIGQHHDLENKLNNSSNKVDVVRQHLTGEIERKIESIPGFYNQIVTEFYKRCDFLQKELYYSKF